MLARLSIIAALVLPSTLAHMSIFTESMYGMNPGWQQDGLDPIQPIGPNVQLQSDWWFRGSQTRARKPQNGSVADLEAGGTWEVEIACNLVWTSFGDRTTVPGSKLDACPLGNAGPYHSGDPALDHIEPSKLAGCALGIADVDDIENTNWDNIAIFSCVAQKVTTFDIPAMMPPCSSGNNFYMTAFDCRIVNHSSSATPIMTPLKDAVFCPPGNTTCVQTTGARRPLYAYNVPTNVPYFGANHRGAYNELWGFKDGAQNDIFEPAASTTSSIDGVSDTFSTDVQAANVVIGTSTSASSSDSLPDSRESRFARRRLARRRRSGKRLRLDAH
ncbi:hypothetical protein MNV49_001128 [Pseudohyphozyma bogoriensis]|nr:hypothetical protein MNV49_001128 [Pseudohyphozyma bogoriensis]